VSSQKVLRVRIIKVSADNGASGNADIVLAIRVEEHGVVDLSAETNGVIQLHE
jgi:hypothetical protein